MAPATTKKAPKKSRGSVNRGYWYRFGRGWYTSANQPLRNPETREHFKDKNTPEKVLQHAASVALVVPTAKAEELSTLTVVEGVKSFLDYSKLEDSKSTYRMRADDLFDFVTGLPPRFRNPKSDEKPTPKDRIHSGYGSKLVVELTPLDIDYWLNAHAGWKGCRRQKIQSLKRCFNYLRSRKIIKQSPFFGFKLPKESSRLTYFTPEQEAKFYELARPDLAVVIKVLIRTGMRYGCEFSKIESKHCEFTEREKDGTKIPGLIIRFTKGKTTRQTGRARLVYISDPELIEIFRKQKDNFSAGPIFRNSRNQPWTTAAMKQAFYQLRKRLEKAGVQFAEDDCLYTTRHTYAKRTLSGYWTGKPTTIEALAKLMGNSVQVCRKYAEWHEGYTDPLWDAC